MNTNGVFPSHCLLSVSVPFQVSATGESLFLWVSHWLCLWNNTPNVICTSFQHPVSSLLALTFSSFSNHRVLISKISKSPPKLNPQRTHFRLYLFPKFLMFLILPFLFFKTHEFFPVMLTFFHLKADPWDKCTSFALFLSPGLPFLQQQRFIYKTSSTKAIWNEFIFPFSAT